MINVGVIGLLLYLLGVRLKGKALTVASLDWEDCEFFCEKLNTVVILSNIRCFLSCDCAYYFLVRLMSRGMLINYQFNS